MRSLDKEDNDDCKVVMVSCGNAHSLFLKTGTEYRVYACGLNTSGQLALPPRADDTEDVAMPSEVTSLNSINIVQVSAGHSHSLFLDKEGWVYKAGDSNGRKARVPILVKALENTRIKKIDHSAAIDSYGRLFILRPGPLLKLAAGNVSQSIVDVKMGLTANGVAVDAQGQAWQWSGDGSGCDGVWQAMEGMLLVKKAVCGDKFSLFLGNDINKKLPQAVAHKLAPVIKTKDKQGRNGNKEKLSRGKRRKSQPPRNVNREKFISLTPQPMEIIS